MERACELRLGVFCEKPLATDAVLAGRMVDAVESAGVPNQVGLVLRSLPSFRQLERLIRDERAGRIMACSFRDDQALPIGGIYGSSWRTDPSKAGRGALLEHSIHDLDILRVLLGPVRCASGVVREFHALPRIDDVAVATLQFESGAVASLTSVWHDMEERPSQRFVEIFCERLYVALEGELKGPVRWRFAGEEEQVLEGRALADAFGDTPANPATSFLNAVRDAGTAVPSFAEALPAHRLADAVYASAARGGATVEDPEGDLDHVP